jgi:glycosyltransferase involved in cell wall biosynthesis
MRVLVVIPAYNEATSIADVALRACRYADGVIIVDDGSQDDTAKRLEGLQISVLRHERNRGKGASLWDGMRGVSDGASTLDADGQHRPEDIPRLVAAARDHPERLIIAARSRKRGRAPKLRRLANGMADFWISWAAGCPIEDSQSGFRLYPAPLIRTLVAGHRPRHGFVFESEVLIEAARMGFRPMAVPITPFISRYRGPATTARLPIRCASS